MDPKDPKERLGDRLFRLRMDRGCSLADVSRNVKISNNFLSEVERGLKLPSDEKIRELAAFYGADEDYLFRLADKVPLRVREELSSSTSLQKLIASIEENPRLDAEKREKLYKRLLHHLEDLL